LTCTSSDSCDGCRCQDNHQWHMYCPYWQQYCDSAGWVAGCVKLLRLKLFIFSQSAWQLDDHQLQEDLWKVQVQVLQL
jgi:hypothetical protein